jgi:Recombinase
MWRNLPGQNELSPPVSYLTDTIWFNPIPLYKNRDFLHQKYVIEGRSIAQIAAEIFSSKCAIRDHLLEFGFKLRKVGGQVGSSRKRNAKKPIQSGPTMKRVIRAVTELHGQGMSLRQIATFLTHTGMPTRGRGKSWHPEMVSRVLKSSEMV